MEYFSTGKHLITDISTIVSENVVAAVVQNPSLGIMEFGNVVVRRDYDTMEPVKIIGGGGSGHDPAYAGYVGKGMLTAAIHGDIFNCPPAKVILRTIKELCLGQDNAEILIIARNDSGNRLNFGVACERAKNDRILAKTLFVGDNCSKNPQTKGKGLSGLIILYKIAGAMAEDGKSLLDIYNYGQIIETHMTSVLLCISPCATPGREVCICLKGQDELEIGTGIHGEPGEKRIKVSTLNKICKLLITDIVESGRLSFKPGMRVIVMVNNMGALPKIEEVVFLKEAVAQLQDMDVQISRAISGRFFTALDMAGISLTVVEVIDDDMLKYLDAPCETAGWSRFISVEVTKNLYERLPAKFKSTARKSPALRGPKLSSKATNIFSLVVTFACDALISCEKQLNSIDSESGDADTGSRIRKGAEAILNEMAVERLKTTHPFTFFQYVSRLLEVVMGGVLGCVYSILFEAVAGPFAELPETEAPNPMLWLEAFRKGIEAMNCYLCVNAGDNTMYDPLYQCYLVINNALFKGSTSILEAFGEGVTAAEIAAQNTVQPGKKYPDAGAHAVGIWLRACYEGVKLRWDEEQA